MSSLEILSLWIAGIDICNNGFIRKKSDGPISLVEYEPTFSTSVTLKFIHFSLLPQQLILIVKNHQFNLDHYAFIKKVELSSKNQTHPCQN